MRISNACSTTLLGLSMAAACPSGHALSLVSLLHLRPHVSTAGGPKAELRLHNPNSQFRDIEVGGHVYTVDPNVGLDISAPVGTPVYAASGTFRKHAKGALLTQVESGRRILNLD